MLCHLSTLCIASVCSGLTFSMNIVDIVQTVFLLYISHLDPIPSNSISTILIAFIAYERYLQARVQGENKRFALTSNQHGLIHLRVMMSKRSWLSFLSVTPLHSINVPQNPHQEIFTPRKISWCGFWSNCALCVGCHIYCSSY
jgi:hypothetical protein